MITLKKVYIGIISFILIIILVLLANYQIKSSYESLTRNISVRTLSPSQTQILQDIVAVKIMQNEETLDFMLEDNRWYIYSDHVLLADATEVFNLLSYFQNINLFELVETNVYDPSFYGINHQSKTLSLLDRSGETRTLMAGNSYSLTHYYVYEMESQTVYLMDRVYFDGISTNITNWRTKDYLQFDRNNAQQILFQINGQTHIINFDEYEENMPSAQTLESERLVYLLQFLEQTRARYYITDYATPEILYNYGLYSPDAIITIKYSSGEEVRLIIKESLYSAHDSYATLDGTSIIFTIPSPTF
ncbi:MAG: hypothetical protein ATN36_03550 [Epulopiscium sp. Nele67-Bin005]|nr:MAG: hypothetical protein ATN36_03550 [Epulopiscium sp. Nele67-Bin005]